ncbi:MAG: hypothetical protein Q8P67_18065, partial [archaeon]|nr:hypothetical protein [archaeon]
HNLALHRVSSSNIAFSPLLPPPSSVQSQSASAGGAAGGSSNSQTLLFEFLQLLFDRVATLHVSPPDTSKQPDDGLLSIHLQSPAFPIALSDRHSIQHTAFQFLAIFNEIASQSHKSQPQPPYLASAKHSPSASSPSSTSSPSATAASVSAAMARAARPPAGGRSAPPARNSPQLPGAPPGLPHTDARHMQQAAGFSTIPTPPSQPASASANSSSGSSRGTSSSRSNPKPSKERSSRGTKKKDRSKKKSSKQR